MTLMLCALTYDEDGSTVSLSYNFRPAQKTLDTKMVENFLMVYLTMQYCMYHSLYPAFNKN